MRAGACRARSRRPAHSDCGIEVQAKKRLLCNLVPVVPGGGVVFYVSRKAHSYIQNTVEREEAGTPNIVGCVRAGLVYHVHSCLAQPSLEAMEQRMAKHLLASMHAHPRIHILGAHGGSKLVDGDGHGDGGPGLEGACGSKHVASIISFKVLYGNRCPAGGSGLYLHHNYVVALLNDLFGVQARGGCACCGPYAQMLLGIDSELSSKFDRCLQRSGSDLLRPGFVRVGIHFTMSWSELKVLEASILWVAQHGWRMLGAYTCDVETGEWQHRLDSPDKRRLWLSSMALSTLKHPASQQEQQDAESQEEDRAGKRLSARLPGPVSNRGDVEACSASADTDQGDGVSDEYSEMPVSALELVEAANDILVRTYSGPLPLRSIRSPLIDPQWAELLWLALPADAHATLLQQQQAYKERRSQLHPRMVLDPFLEPLLAAPHLVMHARGGGELKNTQTRQDDENPSTRRPCSSVFRVVACLSQQAARASKITSAEARQDAVFAPYAQGETGVEVAGQECGVAGGSEDEMEHGLSESLNDSLAQALAAEGVGDSTADMFLSMSAADQATVLANLSEPHRMALLQHITESLSGG